MNKTRNTISSILLGYRDARPYHRANHYFHIPERTTEIHHVYSEDFYEENLTVGELREILENHDDYDFISLDTLHEPYEDWTTGSGSIKITREKKQSDVEYLHYLIEDFTRDYNRYCKDLEHLLRSDGSYIRDVPHIKGIINQAIATYQRLMEAINHEDFSSVRKETCEFLVLEFEFRKARGSFLV